MVTFAELRTLAVAPLEHTSSEYRQPIRHARQCAGKTPFSSSRRAREAATSVARVNGDRRNRPYQCNICHQWHLAHVGRTS